MGHKGSRKVNPLIVAVRFVEYTAIANALDITQCVVAIGAPGIGGFLGLIFRAHLFVVDAGQHVNTLAAERVLCECVGLVDNLIATSRKHGCQWAAWIVNLYGN